MFDSFSADSLGSSNEIESIQRDVAAEIAGPSYTSNDVDFSVSTARQVLTVNLHNFRPQENLRYVLADCEVTLVADDARAFIATGHIRSHTDADRGLVVDQVDLGHFEEQDVWTIPVPATTTLPGG